VQESGGGQEGFFGNEPGSGGANTSGLAQNRWLAREGSDRTRTRRVKASQEEKSGDPGDTMEGAGAFS